MTDPNRDDQSRSEPWHISRAVSLTHILSTVTIIGALFIYFSDVNGRVNSNALSIQHLQTTRDDDQVRTDKKFDEIRGYMLRIESKLDRVIESDR
jgi:hypothetical protein